MCRVDQRRPCPQCGTTNEPQNRFCASCGTQLSATPEQGARVVPISKGREDIENARRPVTVVFADVSNFTTISQQFDTEDVYLFIDEAMALLANVVADYDGTVDKFTGDGLIALFGAPVAHEDDPERGVRAAWEMQRVIQPFRERLAAERGVEFRMRIGVHTGEVVAGKIGSAAHAEFTVIGNTVNLASRLQTAAEPDSVYVSEATYAQTSAVFRYERLQPLTLKGFPEPVPAYRLAGFLSQGVRRRGIPGMTAPLIGRDKPMNDIGDAFRRISSEPTMRIVAISGEAGVGKTRLVSEFLHSTDALGTRAIWATATAVTHSRPLLVIVDLIRTLVGIELNDPQSTQGEIVNIAVAQRGLAGTDVAPYLRHLLGITPEDAAEARKIEMLDAAMLQQQTFAAVRRLFIASAEKTSLIIVIDDMHWADAASHDFLRYFAQSPAGVAVLLILNSREDTALTAADAAPRELVTTIDLRPLDRPHSSVLLRTLLPGESVALRDVRKQIASRSEGNPFFAEELIRTLLDRELMVLERGECRLIGDGDEVLRDVPPTLRGLILARFDCLPPRTRQLLQQASILGRKFPARLLLQISEGGDDVIEALHDLVQRDFLREEAFGLERGYAFSHALTQEAIHATILKRERQHLHAEIARTIASSAFLSRSDIDELLAYHWSESAEPELALPHLAVVAEEAAHRYANDAAVQHCQRALDIIKGNEAHRDIYLRIQVVHGRALKFLGKLSDATANLQDAVQIADAEVGANAEALATVRLAALRAELADARARGGHYEDAHDNLATATLLLAPLTDAAATALRDSIAERMAWVRFRQGRLDEALILADRVARELEASQDADASILASLYNTLGGILWNFGKLDAATSYVRRSLALHRKIGYLFGMANAHTNLGVLCHAQGQWKDAAENYERSDWLRREIGYTIGRAANLKNLAYLRIAMGDHAKARRELETSLTLSDQLGESREAVHALMGLVHLAVLQKRWDDAEKYLAEIHARDLSCLGPDDRAIITADEAMVAAQRRSVFDAIQIAMNACETAKSSGIRATEADCSRILGSLHIAAGNREAAQESLRHAIAIATAIGDPYRKGLSLLDFGDAIESRPERQGAVEEAMRIFTEIGAAYDQERAFAALQALNAEAETA